jgi:membrane dipeptidase
MRLIAVLLAAACAWGQPRKIADAEVQKVHRSAILIDTHNDVTGRTIAGLDLGQRATGTHTDLPRLREGGVSAVFFAAYVAARYVKAHEAARRGLEAIDTIRYDIAARHPEGFLLATSADEIEAAHRQGKVAALIGVEGGHAIENSLRVLRGFYALGARYMTLTHVNTNDWADSCGDTDNKDVAHHNGLTDFGKDVIREMNRLGMAVDVSHISDKTFQDVLSVSRAPVFATHSSCRALSDIPRNMTDEMIAAMARKGGVVQINFGCEFLVKGRRPKVADVVAHIDHVVKLAGIDAVGIGTDYDGVSCVPEGLEDVSKFPALTRALLEQGYSAGDIRKIYGGNTLRFLRAVTAAR